jgi:hypothetical protein
MSPKRTEYMVSITYYCVRTSSGLYVLMNISDIPLQRNHFWFYLIMEENLFEILQSKSQWVKS